MNRQKDLLAPYKTGKMGIAEGMGLAFILVIPRLFLIQPAINVDIAAGLAWLIPILDSLGAFTGFMMLMFVLRRIPDSDLLSAARFLLGPYLGAAIVVFYAGYFFLDAILLLRQFAENTLLTALPNLEFRLAIAIYIITAGLIVANGIEGLARASYLLLPLGVLPLLLVLLLLIPFYNADNLFPWQGTGFGVIIPNGLLNAGINVGALALPILAGSLQNLRTVKVAGFFAIACGGLLRTVCTLVFTLVMGYNVGREKILPFFEMARLVYLSRYVQRIEALFILLWVIYGMLSIAADLFLTCYLLGYLFKLPTLRPIVPTVALIMAYLSMLPSGVTDVILFNQKFILIYGFVAVYAIPALLLAVSLVRGKQRRLPPCAAE